MANKYVYRYREQIPGVEEACIIILKDEKIATMVKKQEMFDEGMDLGCFITYVTYGSRREMNKDAIGFAKFLGCRFVTPKEFREIEKRNEDERVRVAFEKAERMISEG